MPVHIFLGLPLSHPLWRDSIFDYNHQHLCCPDVTTYLVGSNWYVGHPIWEGCQLADISGHTNPARLILVKNHLMPSLTSSAPAKWYYCIPKK